MTLPTAISSRPILDLPHQRIHEGRFFNVTTTAAGLPAGVPKYYLIIGPPAFISIAHMIIIIDVNPGATFEYFENAVISSNGIPLTIINQDRNNPVVATAFAFEDPVVTLEGTVIFSQIIGSTTEGGTGGTKNRNEEEFLFKPLARYLLKITPLSAGTLLSVQMRAYRQATAAGI